ncbi:hypothetical protein ACHAXR_009099 [Thalassiosira sp. AJA248-18]
MVIFGGYKASKLKPQLKMAVTRFQISANKKSALMKQQIRGIAQLLAETPPKEEKARIKAEALIRDDNTVEAYELLELNCELLSERIHLISHSKECPPDLVSCISTLIWASAIVDIPELVEIRKQFKYKYGKDFDSDAMMNVGGVVHERVASRLSVQPPSAYLVQTYLEKIADEHEVEWKPTVPLKADQISEPMVAPEGWSVLAGGGSGLNPPSSSALGGPHDSSNSGTVAVAVAASAPPGEPSFDFIPEAPKRPASTKQHPAYVPVLPTPSTPNAPPPPPATMDDIEEPEIWVPGVPRSPPGGGVKYNNKNDDDDDDSNEGDDGKQANRGTTESLASLSNADLPKGTSDEGGVDKSFDDLAARFAMLQKKM